MKQELETYINDWYDIFKDEIKREDLLRICRLCYLEGESNRGHEILEFMSQSKDQVTLEEAIKQAKERKDEEYLQRFSPNYKSNQTKNE